MWLRNELPELKAEAVIGTAVNSAAHFIIVPRSRLTCKWNRLKSVPSMKWTALNTTWAQFLDSNCIEVLFP